MVQEITEESIGLAFEGLGKALRWMREKQHQKQYQIAETAGITKAMLSAYETGKQRPTLDTLEKILAALDADLGDLFDILQVVNERPAHMRYRNPQAARPEPPLVQAAAPDADIEIDVNRILGSDLVDAEEQEAVKAMVSAYYRWLRALRRR